MRNHFLLVCISFSLSLSSGCGGAAPAASISGQASATDTTASSDATQATAVMPRWKLESSGVTDPLVAIGGGAGDIWIAGSHSILHGRGDGSWSVVKSGETDEYRALYANGREIYVAGMPCDGGVCEGGMLLSSHDGGGSWQRQTFTAAADGVNGDGREVYLVLDGELRVGSDGFATARAISLPQPRGIYIAGGTLFVHGGIRDLEIHASRDGGNTWVSVFDMPGGSKSGHVDAMWSSGDRLFAVGNHASVPASAGSLVGSSDGGASWSPLPLPTMDRASSLWGAASNDVYVLGTQLLHTRDGSTFAPIALPDGTWEAIWGTSARDLYVIGFQGAIAHAHR